MFGKAWEPWEPCAHSAGWSGGGPSRSVVLPRALGTEDPGRGRQAPCSTGAPETHTQLGPHKHLPRQEGPGPRPAHHAEDHTASGGHPLQPAQEDLQYTDDFRWDRLTGVTCSLLSAGLLAGGPRPSGAGEPGWWGGVQEHIPLSPAGPSAPRASRSRHLYTGSPNTPPRTPCMTHTTSIRSSGTPLGLGDRLLSSIA